MSPVVVQRKAVIKELKRRAREALQARRVTNPQGFKASVKAKILSGLHAKQLEVVDAISNGQRYISLCCSRRAGKTYLLASLIVLKLLDAGFNEAVFFVAPSVKIGKGLIWAEVEKLVTRYCLGWKLSKHLGQIDTDAGASFRIIGMNKENQTDETRGFDIVMCLADETQEYEHLLRDFLVATSPALTGRKGVFIAGGTPGITKRGTWWDWCNGAQGFTSFHWDIRQNTKNPRPGDEVLREELERNGWEWDHPTFQREYLGIWVEDTNFLVCEFSKERNQLDVLPEDYSLAWRHVIGIDYGFNDDCAWTVVACDPYSTRRIVVYSDKAPRLIGDQAVERTAALVTRFQSKYVVSDPAGGGKPFYETFNRKYGKELGCTIRSAEKAAGSVVGSIYLLNTELRTGRLQLLSTEAAPLIDEVQRLRWKDEWHDEVMEGADYPDHCFDSLRYSLVETISWQPKTRTKDLTDEEKAQREEERILAGLKKRQQQPHNWRGAMGF